MKAFRLVKPYVVENRWAIGFGLVCLIVVDFLQLLIPRIVKHAVDDLTIFEATGSTLAVYAGYIMILAVLIGAFRYGWRLCLIGTSRKVEEALRSRLFDHIQTLSASYFDKVRTGDLMAHATNDIQHVRMAVGMGIVAFTDAVVLGTAAVCFMAYIHLTLTAFVLIPMPLIVFGTRFFSRRMHRMYRQVQASFSELTEQVRERFAGIRIIKAFNRETDETNEVEAVSGDYVRKNIRLAALMGAFFPMMMFFANLSLVLVLYLGGRHTIAASITPGDFVAFISYLGLLTWPMMALGWVTNLIQRGKASLERIGSIVNTRPAVADAPDTGFAGPLHGEIVFRRVTFAFHSDSSPVLHEIDLKVPAGSMLGIVGPPGSGKTALLSLLPRLYDVGKGQILIDGRELRYIRLEHLRSAITCVPQEPFLFAGNIRDNITFGRSDVSEEQLVEATRKAVMYKTVCGFPNGFDTMVGEKGVILSGGQKQRIALARAMLRDTPVLILDDPISQVDTETGSRIVENLRSMAGRKTVLLASHRLSALWFADQIITLDNGHIVESGTHDRLMAQNGYYARTFRLQQIEEKAYAD